VWRAGTLFALASGSPCAWRDENGYRAMRVAAGSIGAGLALDVFGLAVTMVATIAGTAVASVYSPKD
jgi:hypothetical protein